MLIALTVPSYAGMDFTGFGDKAMVAPPEFMYTDEALKYGQSIKDNQEAIAGLYHMEQQTKLEAREAIDQYKRTGSMEDSTRAMKIATRHQLFREALEATGHVGADVYIGEEPI